MTEQLAIVFLPLAGATFMYFMSDRISRYFAIAIQLGVVFLAGRIFIEVGNYGTQFYFIGNWYQSIGITLAADRYSSVMVLLTSLIILLLLLFDLPKEYVKKQFMILFLFLEALLVGIFLSTDLFNMYVLIEVATIVVTLLILFNKEKRSIYDGLFYIMINMVAMTIFLFGLGFLYRVTGVLDIIRIPEIISEIDQPRSLILPFALMATAVSLKAALFPLFSWLPKAHGTPGAPMVVSAVLSGLYVKTGVFLLFRLIDMFYFLNIDMFFLTVGLLTSFAGIVFALIQTDIKKILGYSTISQIGLIVLGFSFGTDNSKAGAMFHIVNHALFKSALFLTIGLICEKYKTRDIRKITDVFRRMPVISFAVIFAMLGVTGAPLFNGSVSKYLIKTDFNEGFLSISFILINLGTTIYFLRLSKIFYSPGILGVTDEVKVQKQNSGHIISIHRIPPIRKTVVLIFGIFCLLTGLAGGYLTELFFGHKVNLSVKVFLDNLFAWIITLAIGFFLYHLLRNKLSKLQKFRLIEPGFNQVCMGIAVYLLSLIIYLIIVN